MWLTSSSVGRKFVMALTGAALVLFVTFHCLMNSVAIFWPTAYNAVCEFLGANWYALIASAGLALLIAIHIIYACWLTLMNRKARGSVRYAIETRPASVEWSSKNMLLLGIVVIAFLCVHMYQFWAKMQLMEVLGCEGEFPAAAGTLFLQQAFSCWVTPVCYAIGFIALWLHLNHGFWSMFQSVGWDNTAWIPRLKCIGRWWIGIVMVLFFAQLVVFTVNANSEHYLKDEALREQYKDMIFDNLTKHTDAKTEATFARNTGFRLEDLRSGDFASVADQIRVINAQFSVMDEVLAEYADQIKGIDDLNNIYDMTQAMLPSLESAVATFDYMEPASEQATVQIKKIQESKAEMKASMPQTIDSAKRHQEAMKQQQQQMPY